MKIELTPEQQKIIDEIGNCVVLARPGSGKTFTLSYKIKTILPQLPLYRGVIAISYTNKASDELERRCLAGGLERKNSYFGTIDRFFLVEIIIPFGVHLFGMPKQEIKVVESRQVEEFMDRKPNFSLDNYDHHLFEHLSILSNLYLNGYVMLESFGFLALYIFQNSFACRRYLKARYSHIIIDEYQDCGDWQHALFKGLVQEGICGIAVGDTDQSIYAFAKKDSRFLLELAQDPSFHLYPISINHRCHPSIVNYSLRLLNPNSHLLPTDEQRVIRKHIDGCEIDIARWLSKVIPATVKKYEITHWNDIAILVRETRTGNILHEHLTIPHKPIAESPLDNDSSLWGTLFRKILSWVFSPEQTKYELVENYLSFEQNQREARKILQLLKEIENVAYTDTSHLQNVGNYFINIAELIFPESRNQTVAENLFNTLSDESKLRTFIPAKQDEVQIMTLHKSKGLEFDLVFHLSLYDWILPRKGDDVKPSDYIQDINLHYVGITRAKRWCVLCTSSKRHNKVKKLGATCSEFLDRHKLVELRREL